MGINVFGTGKKTMIYQAQKIRKPNTAVLSYVLVAGMLMTSLAFMAITKVF